MGRQLGKLRMAATSGLSVPRLASVVDVAHSLRDGKRAQRRRIARDVEKDAIGAIGEGHVDQWQLWTKAVELARCGAGLR